MKQYSIEEVRGMTYEQLGAIDDPFELMATTSMSPMLVRYVVRTGQLEARYPNVPLPTLLDVMNQAAGEHIDWPFAASQHSPAGVQNEEVDAYLNVLDTYEPIRKLLGKL